MFKTKSSKLIGILAVAGLAVGSGAAFTASNTFGTAPVVAGYGSETVSGATVSDTAINPDPSNAANVLSIAFTTATDLSTGTAAILTLTLAGAVVAAPNTCVSTNTSGAAPFVTTCTFSPTIAEGAFDSIGLTVSST